MKSICLDGKILPAREPVFRADNRGYRYGDGLFETMKLVRGNIILEKFHFERLFSGLDLLRFRLPPSFTARKIRRDIIALSKTNKCEDLARVRLSVFRGNGGLYDEMKKAHYLVECWPLDRSANEFSKKGLVIDLYTGIQKSCDAFSNLKSASFLPYVMAARFAADRGLDDAIINNVKGNIADASIANIFLLKNKLIITPALSEGCVAGVMRRWLLEKLQDSGFDAREGMVNKNDIETFDEVFLTNSIHGIKWVRKFRDRTYVNTQTVMIYRKFVEQLFT